MNSYRSTYRSTYRSKPQTTRVTRDLNGIVEIPRSVYLEKNQHEIGNEVVKVRQPRVYLNGKSFFNFRFSSTSLNKRSRLNKYNDECKLGVIQYDYLAIMHSFIDLELLLLLNRMNNSYSEPYRPITFILTSMQQPFTMLLSLLMHVTTMILCIRLSAQNRPYI